MAKKDLDTSKLNAQQFRELVGVQKDPFYFSTFAHVVHPVRGKTQFLLYPYQKSVLYNFLKNRFNIILKFRQAGVTELISLYCLWLASYQPNKKINIISIKDIVAKKVLKKIKYMYKNLPDHLKVPIINGRSGELGTSSVIEFTNGSFIESIPTSEEAGRSESLSLLVIDEAAIVRWASSIWAASFPTLSCSIGSTPILLRCYEETKKGHLKLLTKTVKLRTLCPKEKGVIDISNLGYYTLTHTGHWKKILMSQNKGKLETWFVEDCKGKIGGYTPKHRLFTTKGWKTIEEIVKYDLNIIQADTKIDPLRKAPVTHKPKEEIIKSIGDFDLTTRGRVLEMAQGGFSYREIANECYPGYKQAHKLVKRVLTEKGSRVYISKLRVLKKTTRTIFDIHVEDDHSYISANNFINHNTGGAAILNSTPFGIGNFYHSKWAEALTDRDSPFNPIRLYWQMHPERDQAWYDTMAKALGPKRTAQEIDGDFLSSGSTVFDLSDIKAIEDTLSEFPLLETRFNGQLRIYNRPEKDTEYYLGADIATGRATDYSAFTMGTKEGEEVAVFKGRIPVEKFATLLGNIGREFNWAKLAPETNDIGLAVTTILQTEGYPNLYYHKKFLKKKGKSKPQVEEYPGWMTTSKNRTLIIDQLEEDIRKDLVIVKDPFFTQEAYTFIYDSLGRPVAMGKHNRNNQSDGSDLEADTYSDDSVMGKAIYNHVRKHSKPNIIIQPK